MIFTDVLRYDDRLFVIAPFSSRVAMRNERAIDPKAFASMEFVFRHLEDSILRPSSAALLPLEWGSPFEMPGMNDTLSLCERHPQREDQVDDPFSIQVLQSRRINAKRRSLLVLPMGRCWIYSGQESMQSDLLTRGWTVFDNPHSTDLNTRLHWQMPTYKEINVRDIVDLRFDEMSGLPRGRKRLRWGDYHVMVNNTMRIDCYWEDADGRKVPLLPHERSALYELMNGAGFRLDRELQPA